jgi:biotin-(acetyl-CoA carboxylase) ligase
MAASDLALAAAGAGLAGASTAAYPFTLSESRRGRKALTGIIDRPAGLVLPPVYSERRMSPDGVLDAARAAAPREGAGLLLWGEGPGRLVAAVTLEPEEPLATARRAIYAGAAALAEAVAALAPPERQVAILWPDTLIYDVARLGGVTLLWPGEGREDAVPDWLVLGVEVLRDRDTLTEPGLFPGSISLAEDGLGPPAALIEAFASYLMLAFDTWSARGFDALARRYLQRVPLGAALRIAADGALVEGDRQRPLAPAILARDWFDPARGGVRL